MFSMTVKNILLSVVLGLFSVLSVFSLTSFVAYADEGVEYKMADDTSAELTFTFRDGTETHSFPVFKMTSDFVSNAGTTFKVQGVVNDAPYLHKALDGAYKHRLVTFSGGSNIEYNFRFFDVTTNISKNDELIRTVNYYDCEVLNYKIETEKDDYESYGFYEKVGFAIVDDIEFRCGGITSNDNFDAKSRTSSNDIQHDYGQTPFKFASDARTFVTFKFGEETERIEFPIFELKLSFEEEKRENNDAEPVFHVEGTVTNHPLLDNAINQARKTSGLTHSFNPDFEALVEFTNNGKVVRGIDFVDCRVSNFLVDTYQDKEEGYTGKRGFSLVEKIGFDCTGLTLQNPTLESVKVNGSSWLSSNVKNEYMENSYNMGTGPRAIATFAFDDGQEIIDFPVFEQGEILNRSHPTFELAGIPGEYPLLYSYVDDSQKQGQKQTGSSYLTRPFDVDISLMYGENHARGFNYSDCKITDYVIKTQHDEDESFFKGFALTNEFHFECQGYHPNSSIYDAMFDTYEKADTSNTNDLRNTDQWGPGFYVE